MKISGLRGFFVLFYFVFVSIFLTLFFIIVIEFVRFSNSLWRVLVNHTLVIMYFFSLNTHIHTHTLIDLRGRRRREGGERETLHCGPTFVCIHWLFSVCALTGERTRHSGVPGWRSNQLR